MPADPIKAQNTCAMRCTGCRVRHTLIKAGVQQSGQLDYYSPSSYKGYSACLGGMVWSAWQTTDLWPYDRLVRLELPRGTHHTLSCCRHDRLNGC